MHELIQDVITVHQAPNLKRHSPNMFPTTGVARLNRSLEEWPRSERLISDGSMKMDSVRSTGYLASPVLSHPMTWGFVLTQETLVCQNMSKHVKRCNLSKWSSTKLRGVSWFFVSILGWKDLCISLQHVALPYHTLEIVELGVTWKTSGGKALVLRTLQAQRLG